MSMIILLFSLFQLPQAPTHVTVTATSSAATAAPGSKMSLFLDIVPKPGIHVYAPGAKGYVPVVVKMDPQPGVTFAGVKYPKSDVLVFEGEKVPVYQQAFRLVEDVSLGRTVKPASTLTLTGIVKYQACDDRVCFIPASVPVRWTIVVR
jgi:DsbC/DsbD-like thiol-disulfide interchange protein